ncbi:MAG: UDP-N-acetylmuramate dehydrogenase [bacterium]
MSIKDKLGNGLSENEPLANHTNFKIGGPARYFFVAQNDEDLIKAVKAAKDLNLAYFILGGGSNILVSDKGFDGLVIKMQNVKIKMQNDNLKLKNCLITAGAGVKLSELIKLALDNGLIGMEFLAGIPGNVGGAIYGNAGAWGKGISDFVKEVKVFDGNEIKIIKKEEADFSYRHSRFKETKEIILEATLELTKGDVEISKQKIKEILEKRHANQPYQMPCAGCTFKNPSADQPAAFLIEQCGLKGKTIGGAQVSEKHANFIVNTGQAKASEVRELTELIKKEVKNKFGVDLEEEIILVGF